MMSDDVLRMRQLSGVHIVQPHQQPHQQPQQQPQHADVPSQDDKSRYLSAPHNAPHSALFALPQSYKENNPPQAPPNLGFRSNQLSQGTKHFKHIIQ